jgi:hypothetical protein
MPRDVVVLFAQEDGTRLIRKHCRRIGLEVADLRRLVDEVIDKNSKMPQRRRALFQAFDEVLDTSTATEE